MITLYVSHESLELKAKEIFAECKISVLGVEYETMAMSPNALVNWAALMIQIDKIF